MRQDPYSKTIRENLRAIRKQKGLTTFDVANILGVSQAKISYIETGRGVLSARDVAVLARHLGIPVIRFFVGLEKPEDTTAKGELANQLAHFGATLLAKPAGVPLSPIPFEEVFSKALSFLEDDRLHKAFCAALILHARAKEIHTDRIFALTANNPFLLKKIAEESQVCLQIIEILNRPEKRIGPRAKRQIEKILGIARDLAGASLPPRPLSPGEADDLAGFVGDCLHAKK